LRKLESAGLGQQGDCGIRWPGTVSRQPIEAELTKGGLDGWFNGLERRIAKLGAERLAHGQAAQLECRGGIAGTID